ncbi:glycoside hydrolase family 47 protein [Stipitochalara longipes BDJ]|nr:glycoside hydrolase family 47 protein [Stipitochalara longipes BDJ]
MNRVLRRLQRYGFALPALSTRQIRYIAFAIFVLVIYVVFLPSSPVGPSDTKGFVAPTPKPPPRPPPSKGSSDKKASPFRIQAKFGTETGAAKDIRLERQKEVKEAFVHAWEGYKKHAWLHDEVLPISGGHKDPFVGWAATLVDGLDTLYIMGLQDEFEDALKALEKIDFSKPNAERIPVFETTIRYLGGMLGAYDISEGKYPILLEKADQLGEMLFRAFKTANGIPVPYYWWQKKQKLQGESNVLIAQIGSLSLEFTRLAQLTGKKKYFEGISRITDHLDKAQNHTRVPGLWPWTVDTTGPTFPSATFTLGAWADSLYEYLPKEHLLLGGASDQYLRMYNTALVAASKYHFFKPKTPGDQDLLFTGKVEASSGTPTLNTEVQHLGCFVGGMVGLGARINDSPTELAMAIRLSDSCYWAYTNTASGIMPEIFHIEQCPAEGSCTWTNEEQHGLGKQYGFTSVDDTSYQLRPEAIESIFIMWRITGDPEWMEKGWLMWQAIAKHTRTEIANARLGDVTSENPQKEDSMESFWLAETLKYFYLLFSETDLVSLDKFVLNTEAHPFRQQDNLLP